MALLVNGAGASAADPILNGLGLEWVIAASTMDAATFTNAWIDQAAGFPGTTSITGQLSPATSVVTQGNAGTYSHTTHQYTISSTTGISVGDYLYLSGGTGGGSITGGLYKIASIPSGGVVTLATDPLAGAASDVSGIAYEVAWRTTTTIAGSSPMVSSAGGTQNYFKAQLADSVGNAAQQQDSNYIENAPTINGTGYLSIDGKAADGTQTTKNATTTLTVLSGWANHGGVSQLGMANHSTQARNDFTWGDGTTAEKTYAAATAASGIKMTGSDGAKYGRLLLKSLAGAAVTVGVDISMNLDTTAPTVVFTLNGR